MSDATLFLSTHLGSPPKGGQVRVALNRPPKKGVGPGGWEETALQTLEEVGRRLQDEREVGCTYVSLSYFDRQRGKKRDAVIAKRTISADLDAKSMPGATEEIRRDQVNELVTALPTGLTVVDSGYGVHVHALLPERLWFESLGCQQDAIDLHHALARALRLWLEEKAQRLFGSPVKLDRCHGVERVWRVPGGVNAKAGEGAKELTSDRSSWRRVTILRRAEGSFDIHLLDAHLDEARKEEQDPSRRRANGPSITKRTPGSSEPFQAPPEMQANWPYKDTDNRSERDFARACHGLRSGRSDTWIAAMIRAARRAGGDPKSERDDYIHRTIERAHGVVGGDTNVPTGGSPEEAHPFQQNTRETFPMDVFPPVTREYVEAKALTLCRDPSGLATAALVCAAGVVGATRAIELKRSDWIEACILWAGIVGATGTNKSAELKAAMEAALRIHLREANEYKERNAEVKEMNIGAKPIDREPLPTPIRLLLDDATLAATARALEDNPRGMLSGRDELSGMFGSLDEFKAGTGGDVARLLPLHEGGLLQVDRAGGGMITVPHAHLSVIGSIQPMVLRSAVRAKDGQHFDNGLVPRLMLVEPEVYAYRFDAPSTPRAVVDAYRKVFDHLRSLQPKHAGPAGGAGSLQDSDASYDAPHLVRLTEEARRVFGAVADEFGALAHAGSGTFLGAVAAKSRGRLARITLVLYLLEEAESDGLGLEPVSVEFVERAATLTRWYLAEAERVAFTLEADDGVLYERMLLKWMQRQPNREGFVSTISNRGPRPRPKAAERDRILDSMDKRGVIKIFDGETGRAGRPGRRWRVL